MRKIAIIILLLCLGCAPKPLVPAEARKSQTPSNTPTAPEITSTVRSTTVLPPDILVPAPASEVEASLYIFYLKMVDANHGWAIVSGQGLPRSSLLHTVDGGITWDDVTPPQLISLRNHANYFSGSMAVLDANTAWAIADGGSPVDDRSLYGTVWRTDDGGSSWSPGNPINIYKAGPQMIVNGFTTKLYFGGAQDGWLRAIIQGVMGHTFDTWYRTTNGGLTWTRLQLPNDCADYVTCDYLFVNETYGFRTLPTMGGVWSTVGDIQTSQAWQIEKTADGGSTWSRIMLTPPADLVKDLFAGQNYQPSQIAGSKINIKQRFTQFDSGVVGLRMEFVVYSAEDTAHPLFERGVYYISDPGGQTWQSFLFSGDLFFLTETTGWRFSRQGVGHLLEKTSDGGKTWELAGKEISETGNIQFADDLAGWMILQKPDFSTRLMRTIDGGQSWVDITANMWESLLSKGPVDLPSGALPPMGVEPWIARMQAGSPLVFNSIDMSDAEAGWATSLNGYIFHTNDGGSTWRDVTPKYGTIDSQRDFFALDAIHAWTVILPLPGCITETHLHLCPDYYVNRGPVWYTNDGGQTWNPGGLFPDPERSFETQLVKIRFANEQLGWAQWLSRDFKANQALYHLYKTSDGSLSWLPVITEPYQEEVLFLTELTAFKFESSPGWAKTLDDFMAGAALGVLQKTLDGGKTWEPVTLPNFVFNAEDLGIHNEDVSSIFADCFYPEMHSVGAQGIVVKVPCNISDVVDFSEIYYSLDSGESWNNWTSDEYALTFNAPPRWEQWMASAGEFFLAGGVGWRLYKPGSDSPAWIQQTIDGGRSWNTIKTVAWQSAKFNFVNERDGWAIVTHGNEVGLVHTSDGGKSWEEIKPVAGNR